MSRRVDPELEAFRAEGVSAARRRELRESARVAGAWDRAHALDLPGAFDWIDQLRAAFGDPEVDRRPWRGDDFRI
jgi:hypothetical protein